MLEENVLDLAGGEVLAAANDDVVEAALDVEVAVVVEVALVVGGEPAITWPTVFLSVILARHLFAADPDLAAGDAARTTSPSSPRTVISTVGSGWPTEPRRLSHVRIVSWPAPHDGRRASSTAIDELVSVSP